jgi:hypothetical protein
LAKTVVQRNPFVLDRFVCDLANEFADEPEALVFITALLNVPNAG